jgi:hypothetical protein
MSVNVLLHRGRILPVDWQAAALSAAEVDVVALPEAWPAHLIEHFESEYRKARWPGEPPPGHRRQLWAARLYWHLRRLGDSPNGPIDPRSQWRFSRVRTAAARLQRREDGR